MAEMFARCSTACASLRTPAAPSAAVLQRRRHGRWQRLPPACAAANANEQLSMVASRLSTVRSRELLAASCVELLKAALVGSATPSEGASSSGGTDSPDVSPEGTLELLHASLQASMQDAAHHIASEHHEAWGAGQWEAFQAAHAIVQRLLMDLHSQAGVAGSAAAELQVARCLEHGLLVPQDAAAAVGHYQRAAALGSAEAAVRCGIHYFEGTAPGGRDGPKAYDCFSRALDLLVDAGAGSSGGGDSSGALPPLAAPSPETAADGDVTQPLAPNAVRSIALTWIGRCYLEGAGVERSVADAVRCFREAGNTAELGEIAMLKLQFAAVSDGDLAA